MSNINMKEWSAQTMADRRVAALPIMTHPAIEWLGHTVREAVCDGRIQARAVMATAQRYPVAAATTIMDLTVEAEAFGARVDMSGPGVPAVVGRLLTDADDIGALAVPSLDKGRVPLYVKACLIAARSIADRPLLAGCIGPFSLAGRLFGMSEMMVLLCEDAPAAHRLLDKCTAFITKYCMALRTAGANGVVMAEPAAGLLSADDCRRFSSEYVRRVVEKVQDDGFMLVLHNCGNTGHCTRAMVETGAAAYHFGNKCRMGEVIKDVPANALVMGNLDPVSVFKDGTAEHVRKATRQLLDEMRGFPNFVISSGCDIPPNTPLENIDAFFEETTFKS